MANARIEILHEVGTDYGLNEWNLYFQWGRFDYDDGTESQTGYRFIWRRPDESLQAARGQARIPSADVMFELIARAAAAGWLVTCERLGAAARA
jgi:hypothetical protein